MVGGKLDKVVFRCDLAVEQGKTHAVVSQESPMGEKKNWSSDWMETGAPQHWNATQKSPEIDDEQIHFYASFTFP